MESVSQSLLSVPRVLGGVGVVSSLNEDAIDLAHEKPRLLADVSVWPAWENGERVYRICHEPTGRYYRLGYREYALISLFDGRHTVASACGLVAAHLGREAISSDDSKSIVLWLFRNGLISLDHSERLPSRWKVPQDDRPRGGFRWNPFWVQVPLIKRSQTLNPLLQPMLSCLGHRVAWLSVVMLLLGVGLFAWHGQAVYRSAGDLYHRDAWITLAVIGLGLKGIHEWGHAVVCRRLGGKVREAGVVFVLLAPLAYVDVSSCWRMSNRWDRIWVTVAGMWIEGLIASLAMWVWWLSDDVATRYWCSHVIIAAGVSTLIFNANPLMRFDGYYLLSDLIQIPNLQGEAKRQLGRLAQRLFFGTPPTGYQYRGWKKGFLVGYAIASTVWKSLLCVLLCVAASMMFSGAGVLLAVLGLLAWGSQLTTAALRWLGSVGGQFAQVSPLGWIRAAAMGMFCIGSLLCLMFLPFSTQVRVPAVVEDPPESLVRSSVDGFVDEIFVADGQRVEAGQRLMKLSHPELLQRIERYRLLIAEQELRVRIASDLHDPSAVQNAVSKQVSLQHQLDQLLPKAASLHVVAPCSGVVRSRTLPWLHGGFVREGDLLLRIGGVKGGQLVGLVRQQDVTLARDQIGSRVQVRSASRLIGSATVTQVTPRTTLDLPAPALAATFGGPMAVTHKESTDRKSQPNREQLTEPHFVIRAGLEAGHPMGRYSGMRVEVALGVQTQSLWQRCQRAFWRHWHRELDASRKLARLFPRRSGSAGI